MIALTAFLLSAQFTLLVAHAENRFVEQETTTLEKSNFNMAFVLVTPRRMSPTIGSIKKLQLLKSKFSGAFYYATNGLATMSTHYPVQIIRPDSLDLASLLNQFYEDNPDEFDFLSIYGDGVDLFGNVLINFIVRNDIVGIGIPVFDTSSDLGSDGRLRSINVFPDINRFSFKKTTRLLNGLLHETGHTWCCYVGDNFTGNTDTHLEIKQQNRHFYGGLESPYDSGTAMGSNYWVLNEDGTYRRENNQNKIMKYHPFQLYLMGLLPPSEFNRRYKVFDVGTVGNDFHPDSAVFHRKVNVWDIIREEGFRQIVEE